MTTTGESTWLTGEFAQHRAHLRRVAYRMLGSLSDADEAVQETWLRVARAGADGVENIGGWMTAITSRVCLNMLRARKARREEPLGARVPDPIVRADGVDGPEGRALLAESVGLALLIVLDTLPPAERIAFVLHDMFGTPFSEIATMVGRNPTAARQLASRARRRIQDAGISPRDPDFGRHRQAVDAFFRAARRGDFDALLALLDPDVVARLDAGDRTTELSGAASVARTALALHDPATRVHPVVVGGAAGAVVTLDGHPIALIGFAVTRGRITRIDAISEPSRVRRLTRAASLRD